LAEPIALVFDLDGTLIDSAPEIHAAVNKVFSAKGLPLFPIETVKGFIGNGVGVLVARLLASAGQPDNGPLHAETVRDFVKTYEEAHDLTTLYPGTAEALTQLHEHGHPLGICTNKPEGPARHILRHFKLDNHFRVVVGGDTLSERKPHPAPLWAAFAALGSARQVFVGDSEVDAATAKAAEIPLALFAGGYRKAAADSLGARLIFDHHAALPRLIAHLEPRL
jgi:phosphoglycolate phosphatase